MLPPRMEEAPLTVIDRPRMVNKIVATGTFGIAIVIFQNVLREHNFELGPLSLSSLLLVVAVYVMGYEFLLRPVRVTTFLPDQRAIFLQETAPLRSRQLIAVIPPENRFEIRQADSDNEQSYEVRVRSKDFGVLRIAESRSRDQAEAIARQANAAVRFA